MNKALQSIWNAFLTATVVTMLAGLFVAAMPPVYRATATVKGEPDGMLIIQSGELLGQVMQTSGIKPDDLYGWLEEWAGSDVAGAVLLKQKLFVSAGAEPGWIDVTVEGRVAKSTAVLANEIVKAYLDRIRQNELTVEAKAALYQIVESRERELAGFLAANPRIVDFRNEKNRFDAELRGIDQRIAEQQRRYQQVESQITLARQGNVSETNDAAVKRVARERDMFASQLASLETRYGKQHKRIREAQAKLNEAENQLRQAFSSSLSRLSVQARQVEAAIQAAESEKVQKNRAIEQLLALEVQHQKYRMARQSALDQLNGMTQEQRRYEFSEATPPSNTLGFSQLLLLGGVFGGVFVLVQLLTLGEVQAIRSMPR